MTKGQPACLKLASITVYALVRQEYAVGDVPVDDQNLFHNQNEYAAGMVQDLMFRQFYFSGNLQHINIDKL